MRSCFFPLPAKTESSLYSSPQNRPNRGHMLLRPYRRPSVWHSCYRNWLPHRWNSTPGHRTVSGVVSSLEKIRVTTSILLLMLLETASLTVSFDRAPLLHGCNSMKPPSLLPPHPSPFAPVELYRGTYKPLVLNFEHVFYFCIFLSDVMAYAPGSAMVLIAEFQNQG